MQWQPLMTAEEADRWAVGTALPGPWYHGTRASNRGLKLLEVGFNPEPTHIGLQKYGNGLYLTNRYDDAKNWGPVVFEARLHVNRSRLGHCNKYPGLIIFDDVAEDLGVLLRFKELSKSMFQAQAFALAVKEKDIDAYTVGGDWVVMTNPQCLVFMDTK